MESYGMMTDISLASFKHKDLKEEAAQAVVASSGKKPDSFKRRVEVFAAACSTLTHLPVRRSSRPSQPGNIMELAAIEASMTPLGPTADDNISLPHSVSLGAHSVLVSDMSSQRSTESSTGGAHPEASGQAHPQAAPKRTLSACLSTMKTHCKSPAAALSPKHSNSSNSRRNRPQQAEETFGDADILGMDPCAYKLSFVAPRWLTKPASKGASAPANPQPTSRCLSYNDSSSASAAAAAAAAAVSQESAKPAAPSGPGSTSNTDLKHSSGSLDRFKTRLAGYFQKLPSVHIPSFKPSPRQQASMNFANAPATPSPCGEAPSMWGLRRRSSQRQSSAAGAAGSNANGGSRRSTGPRCSSSLAQWLHDLPAMPEVKQPFRRQSSGGRSTGSAKGSSGGGSSGGSSQLSRIASGLEENYSMPFSQ